MDKLSLQNDMIFKSFFGRERDESKQLLTNLINAVLKRTEENKIISIQYKNPFNLQDNIYESETILDIKAVTNEEEHIDIEMQNQSNGVFIKRSLLYWSKLHSGQYTKDTGYSGLKRSICINILGDELFKFSDDYHYVFKVMETSFHEVLCDDLEIHYIELPRISDIIEVEEVDELVKWMVFIKDIHKKSKERVINDLAENEDIMDLARSEYNKLVNDPYFLEKVEAREKFIMDQRSREYLAKEEGIEQGIEQGMRKVALNMKEQGYSDEEIVSLTGMTLSDVVKLNES